jgi:hypothetical protein
MGDLARICTTFRVDNKIFNPMTIALPAPPLAPPTERRMPRASRRLPKRRSATSPRRHE